MTRILHIPSGSYTSFQQAHNVEILTFILEKASTYSPDRYASAEQFILKELMTNFFILDRNNIHLPVSAEEFEVVYD